MRDNLVERDYGFWFCPVNREHNLSWTIAEHNLNIVLLIVKTHPEVLEEFYIFQEEL